MAFVYYVADVQPHTFGGVAVVPEDNTNFLTTMLESQGFRVATLAEYQLASDACVSNTVAQPVTQAAGTTDDGIAATLLSAPKPDIQDQLDTFLEDAPKKGKKATTDAPTEDQPPADANT